jgi:stage II sporulation protein D
MKKLIICLLLILLFLLPMYFLKSDETEQQQLVAPAENKCTLMINVNGEEVELNDYLIGVLAGEMPISFHEEALKAQAIAARTYALRQTDSGKKEIQSTTAHQVFNSTETRQQKWKTAFAANETKLAEAVKATENQVLMYDGQYITAMFHSTSIEQTESAKNYSGNSIPYLQAVSSPEQRPAEENLFTFKELNRLLQQNFSSKQYRNAKIIRNDTNRVDEIEINGVKWTGRDFRNHLNLRSTNFSWQWSAKGVTIKTLGFGHGVGMSQYGADTMAKNGYTVEQILAHYYPGAKLEKKNFCTK